MESLRLETTDHNTHVSNKLIGFGSDVSFEIIQEDRYGTVEVYIYTSDKKIEISISSDGSFGGMLVNPMQFKRRR